MTTDRVFTVLDANAELPELRERLPRLREARELSRRLDDRARELRTAWLLRQADARRATS